MVGAKGNLGKWYASNGLFLFFRSRQTKSSKKVQLFDEENYLSFLKFTFTWISFEMSFINDTSNVVKMVWNIRKGVYSRN